MKTLSELIEYEKLAHETGFSHERLDQEWAKREAEKNKIKKENRMVSLGRVYRKDGEQIGALSPLPLDPNSRIIARSFATPDTTIAVFMSESVAEFWIKMEDDIAESRAYRKGLRE